MIFIRKIHDFLFRNRIATLNLVPTSIVVTDEIEHRKTSIANSQGELSRVTQLAVARPEDTVIGEDAVMTGTLKVGGRVIVQGQVSGLIEEKQQGANVFIDEFAVVRGEIHASNTLIYGEVEGSITSTRISIEKTSNIRGLIQYRDIRIKGGLRGAHLMKNKSLRLLIEDSDTQLAITH